MTPGPSNRLLHRLRHHCGVLLLGLAGIGGIAVAAEQAGRINVRPDAPQQYTVERGDTLWDISGRFLEEPWMWPEVWQVNPQISNPDLIYPGDVISLTYVDGAPVLTLARDGAGTTGGNAGATLPPPAVDGLRTERLSPQVRRESIYSPIAAIPLERIGPLLSGNSVMDASEFEAAPYVLANREGHTFISQGDEVYARGAWSPNAATYDIVRQGRDYIDPDTGELIGVEAMLLGTATITSYNGDRAIMRVDSSLQDIRAGDRLVVHQPLALDASYLPRPPAFSVDAAIASIGSGKLIGGQYDTLVLNRGRADGLESGHLLTVQKPAVVLEDSVGKASAGQRLRHAFGLQSARTVEFPGDDVASVLIYRVFDEVSLGVVLESSTNISLNDRVATP